jgi:DNA-binding MarR family transcriptional regulator
MTGGGADGLPGDQTEASMELWQNIRTIYRAALKRLNARLAKEKITFSQYSVLLALSRAGPMQMNRLSEHMLVAPANVTGLVDRLGKKGYVRRKRDPKDHRLYVIEPTENGTRIFKSISGRFSQYTGGLGSELTQDELAVTLRVLEKVRQKVQAKAEI